MVDRRTITIEEFTAAVGRPPGGDDMDRVNCGQAGEIGHYACGWNDAAALPYFMSPDLERELAPSTTGEFEWRHGGSEPLHFTNRGPRWWAAVWPAPAGRFTGWVSGPPGSEQAICDTQEAARAWCEARLRDNVPALQQ